MSFPVDILGRRPLVRSASRAMMQMQGSHRAIIKSLGHPSGFNLGGNSREPGVLFISRFAIGRRRTAYGPRVWMGVNKNSRQADRQHYATPLTRSSAGCFQHHRRKSGCTKCQLARSSASGVSLRRIFQKSED